MSEALVTINDVRSALYCWKGTKTFLVFHGIDPRRLKDGIPVSELRALKDEMANKVCDNAEKRMAENG